MEEFKKNLQTVYEELLSTFDKTKITKKQKAKILTKHFMDLHASIQATQD